MHPETDRDELLGEIEHLQARLEEAEETLRAIRAGEVDALVVSGAQGQEVYSLQGAEHPYRVLIEQMSDGAATLSLDGIILFCNRRLAELLETSLDQLLGQSLFDYVAPGDRAALQAFRRQALEQNPSGEMTLQPVGGSRVCVLARFGSMELDSTVLAYLVVTDITERKRAEEEQKRLVAILEATPDFVGQADGHGRALYLNRAGRAMVGLNAEDDITHTSMGDYHPPGSLDTMVATAIAEGKWQGETVFRRRDGTEFVASQVLLAHRSADEEVEYYSTIARDITKRKQIEEALHLAQVELEKRVAERTGELVAANAALRAEIAQRQEAENKVRLLLDSSGEGIFGLDLQGRCTFCNPAGARFLGCPDPQELLGKDTHALFHHSRPDGTAYPADECPIYQVFRHGRAVHVDNEVFWRADGTCFPVEYRAYPVRREGQVIGAVCIFSDITERRRAEELRHRLMTILERTPDFVGIADATTRQVRYINKAGRQMVGLGEQDDVSRFHIHDFHPARVNAQLSGEILPRVSREGVWIGETAILTRDGREIPVLMVSIAHLSADGKLDVFSTISRDISDRKRWEQELEQARDAAEEASRAKSEFLANMSHEIRTPMNGVLGMTALVLETELTAQQRQYLEVVRESGESLLQLLNDILDFSKIEAGHLDFHEVDFSLAEILGRVVRAFALPAHQKGLQLTCDVAPGTVDRLVGDPERLRQVLFNLVSNAIKFTPRGEVALRARVETLTDDALVLHVAVQDTGIGIKPELQQVIFEPFRQADSSTTRRYGGTGLGLTICTRLIERMGGRIWLESAVGQGSTFHVTARLRRSRTWPAAEDRQRPAQAAGEAKGREGPRLHVLLVEDNPINQRVALHMLEDLGHAVTVAANGREALEVQARERFDLALMDVQMPGMDGFEVTAAIRDREKQTGLHLPILALTAHVMDGDRELCLASGMDGYLAKPIQPEEFRRALANLPGGRRTACHSGPPGSAVRPALDQAALLARVGNPQRLGRLVEIFRDSCPAMLQAVRDALGRADATGLSRAVHALKGSLGSLSATAAFEAAQKLEEMGKSGDLSHAAGALAVLEQEVDRFQAELAKLIQEERP